MPILILLLVGLVIFLFIKITRNGDGIPEILVGSLILVVLGFLDPNNLGMTMVFGIICTAGLGLIPFILVAWILGSIVLGIGKAFGWIKKTPGAALAGKKEEVKEQKKEPAPVVPQDMAALKKYIAETRGSGILDWEAKRRLLKQGWPADQVDDAMKS